MTDARRALEALDWAAIRDEVLELGFSQPRSVLDEREARALRFPLDDGRRFRARVDMAGHGFGSGRYAYFAYPLPAVVSALRGALYHHARPIAGEIAQRLGLGTSFPDTLAAYQARCAGAGQTQLTPLLLHYRTGDHNCLHQDIYGSEVFPLQALVALSQPEQDYSGGENLFLLAGSGGHPRGFVCRPRIGQLVVFCSSTLPLPRGDGTYLPGELRHGLAPLHSGERYTLGLILHDAAPGIAT